MRFPRFTTLSSRLALTVLAAGAAAPALAQSAQTTPPANGQLPQTIPGLDNFTIAPRKPLPMPVPLPSPTPTPTPVVPIQPLPSPTPTPHAAAPQARRTPAAVATPAPSPTPTAAPAPTALPTAAPTPASTPTAGASPALPAAPAPAAAPRHSLLWIALFIVLLLLPALGVVLWFARRSPLAGASAEPLADDDDDDWIAPDQAVAPPPPAPRPVAPPRQPPGTATRPRLEIGFTPRGAGVNGANAAVDYDLVVQNAGPIVAEGVQLRVELVTAGNTHDAELQARLDAPIEKPMIAPFTLAAGQARPIRAVAQLPRSAVNVVSVQGRPMFVPIVAIDLRYRWPGGEGQTAQSFVIGIAPREGERMRPFWLDVPPRMYDAVTARPHSVGARR